MARSQSNESKKVTAIAVFSAAGHNSQLADLRSEPLLDTHGPCPASQLVEP